MNAPTITPELIRELIKHRERDKLDFKEMDYDWSDRDRSRAELAKDLMAMGNRLARGDDPSYILIGVKEKPDGTGDIVGLLTPHLADAPLHQKVSGAGLNRVPNFLYAAVVVDGRQVGVYQILPDNRPYYFMAGARKYQALQRVGSSTDLASPDEIYQWAKADDPISEELRTTKLDETKARAAVRGDVETLEINGDGRGRVQKFRVTNHGQLPFTIQRAVAIFGFNNDFYVRAQTRGVNSAWRGAKWDQPVRLPGTTLVSASQASPAMTIETTNEEARNQFLGDARIGLGEDAEKHDWRVFLECEIEVEVGGAGGESATLRKSFRWL